MANYIGAFLSGVLFIEFFGYIYHRWLEHGELLRYLSVERLIAKIIGRHATHHNKLYPSHDLRPDHPYVTEDILSWYLPGVVLTVLSLWLRPEGTTLVFILGGWLYGLAIDHLHQRFHLKTHFLADNKIFLYVQKIHDLHHSHQEKNFTIVFPLLDVLFRSYLSPRALRTNG